MAEGNRLGPVARRVADAERVLIVEDDLDLAERLRAFFRACGYDVVHVDPDGSSAVVAAVEEHAPSCVLLDLTLRGFCGAEAYRAIRAEGRLAHVPMIVMTARPDVDELLRIADTDAVATEPCNFNALADLVAARIARLDEPTETLDTAPARRDETEESLSIAM